MTPRCTLDGLILSLIALTMLLAWVEEEPPRELTSFSGRDDGRTPSSTFFVNSPGWPVGRAAPRPALVFPVEVRRFAGWW